MARRSSRTRPCRPEDAAQRYDQAKAFADLAVLDPESGQRADTVGSSQQRCPCGHRSGRLDLLPPPRPHAAGDDHQQAIALVEEAGNVGQKARRHLETLLSIKHKAQYEDVDPTVTEAKRAIRPMRSILELAAQA